MSITTTTTDDTVPMPPHLRRAVAGLDGLITRAEAARARWAANGETVAGDRRSATLTALADEWLAQLRASRTAVLADSGRRRSPAG